MKKLILTLLLFLPTIALANPGTYKADVYVDVSADDAATARQKAMNIANRNALNTVLKKISTDETVAKFDELGPEHIINFIRETAIINEKASNVRYIANLRVTINEKLLKDYMKEKGYPLINDAPSDVLIIPVYRDSPSSEPKLFSDDNIWLAGWNNSEIQAGSTKYHTIKSYVTIDVEDIMSLSPKAFERIAKIHNINDIYVVEAYTNHNHNFEVKITPYSSGAPEVFEVDGNGTVITEAIRKTAERINNIVKKQKANQIINKNSITAIYSYPNIKSWSKTEKDLNRIEQINNVNTDAFSNGKVQLKIEFTGTIENLQRALSSKGYSLQQFDNLYLLEKIAY
ncbi:MAG: hypothetical protein LBL47_00695 [Lactobacillus sp.]|nr:hypothetical protein [Lactobacillus sp.]